MVSGWAGRELNIRAVLVVRNSVSKNADYIGQFDWSGLLEYKLND